MGLASGVPYSPKYPHCNSRSSVSERQRIVVQYQFGTPTNNNGNGNGQGPCSNNGQGSGSGGSGPEVFEKDQYYYHPDHLGSWSYVTDLDGDVFQHLEYFPFGETWVEEHSNTQRTPWLFTGKELDEETGLYYFGARYYDPRTSVWQSPDPILAGRLLGEGAWRGVFVNRNSLSEVFPQQCVVLFKYFDDPLAAFLAHTAPRIARCWWLTHCALDILGAHYFSFHRFTITGISCRAEFEGIAPRLRGWCKHACVFTVRYGTIAKSDAGPFLPIWRANIYRNCASQYR
ncbi:MAG: hypothetical protein GKR98_09005 [Boseongicola sp.]|nr:MAG: hypothetical protein GKR98_09005 [Boseongicola sp.]